MNKAEINKIRKVLKYNTSRQYFGQWMPIEIHEKYDQAIENPESQSSIYTGQISMNDICDTLWNEMSYNPVRFGTKNPFIFNGVKDPVIFALKYSDEKYKTKNAIFFKIATLLKDKIYDLTRIDPMFSAVGHTQNNVFQINNPTECRINQMYYILSSLAKSIHAIASQNLIDFKTSKRHRIEIIRVVKERHPNLIRPMKNVNYAEMEKQNKFVNMLRVALANKQTQIESTNISIESLRELEQPGDTSGLELQLAQQQRQYDNLETICTKYESEYNKLLMEWKNKHRIR